MTCFSPSRPSRAPRELEPRTASEAEQLEDARDQFAVEAVADENGGVGAAEVDRARQHALVPEAVDLRARAFAEESGVTPSSAITSKRQVRPMSREQRPHQTRNHGQHEALGEGESAVLASVVTV